jgi:Raf kinase inhibitor-like YbhB/YbcL family protein
MWLNSPAFKNGAWIPAEFTCDGLNHSPPLAWGGVPAGVGGFALLADDPDAPAGTWTHWVVVNIPAGVRSFPAGANRRMLASSLGLHGINHFLQADYGGPCPPPGRTHRYFFRLYALDQSASLSRGATRSDLEAAVSRHWLAEAVLFGMYGRKARPAGQTGVNK